jgi:hypothetical protein
MVLLEIQGVQVLSGLLRFLMVQAEEEMDLVGV